MALKDLLVYVDATADSLRRLRLAVDLAARHESRLTALFVREWSRAQADRHKAAELGLISAQGMRDLERTIETSMQGAADRLQTALEELTHARGIVAELRCVDDSQSPLYNRVAVADRGERMRRDDELYRYTVFVRHNDAHTPGRGSCIFLHVWKDAASPTVGCTAMALDDLRALIAWLDRDTLLVQLPRAEYEARQRDWGLPQRK